MRTLIANLRRYFTSILRRSSRVTETEANALPRPSVVHADAESGYTHAQVISHRGQRVLDLAAPEHDVINRVQLVADQIGMPARVEAVGDGGTVNLALLPKGAAGQVQLMDGGGTTRVSVTTGAVTVTGALGATRDAAAGLSDVAVITKTNSGGAGQANDGAALLFEVENGGSATAEATRVGGVLTDVTPGAEASALVVQTREAGGALAETLRATSNGTLQLTGSKPTLSARTAATALSLTPSAGGSVVVTDPAANTVLAVEQATGGAYGLATEHAASDAGGAVAINAIAGRFRILAGAGLAATVITNNRVLSADSKVFVSCRGTVAGGVVDATLTSWAVVPAAGQFTFVGNANATADTDFDFFVLNPAA